MKYLTLVAVIWFTSIGTYAQDANAAAQIAAERERAEFERRMVSRMEELIQANNVQQRRIGELRDEIATLRRQVIESENRFKNSQIGAVNSQDLRKVYDKMAEMEKARSSDKELILDQMKRLGEIASKPPVIITQAPPPTRNADPKPITPAPNHTKEPEPETESIPEFAGEHYTYKIQKNDTLTAVISAYNSQLKEKGKAAITLQQVLKANPKLNPNNLVVGREIKIPVPPDK